MTITVEKLLAFDFSEKRYEGQEGIFITKVLKAKDMPAVLRDLVDEDEVLSEHDVIVELTPYHTVQAYIPDADLLVGQYDAGTEDALDLLRDAGYPF